jgi:putative tryptophan/tyrosine transport system substrate-binding protein
MRRREFITVLGGAATAWPLAAQAQQSALPVVAFLRNTSPDPALVAAFRKGLSETGYVEGQNVTVEYRWTEGERLATTAGELVRRQVNVIAAGGLVATLAAKAATSTIPIVFATGDDPVQVGLVSNLNRPGGNITGASFLLIALVAKRAQLLRELVPSATIVGFLVDPRYPTAGLAKTEAESAALAHGFQLLVLNASSESEIETAFVTLHQHQAGALIINANEFFVSHTSHLVALAARYRVPTSYQLREAVEAGGLISYGASFADSYRQAGVYAGRILKGEKPGDIPIIQPTKFELVINLKTAKALGLTVPPALLVAADEVIE